ncbi:hypothetical protein FACS1894208_12200 [Clostridia bacterium]|nr:hypothetical protein FACS1894208_12200 [Clostridia bacterium]
MTLTIPVTLKKGLNSAVVKLLQTALNAKGAKLTVDGSFGNLTENAIKAFQKSVKLPETGIVDNATWSALEVK